MQYPCARCNQYHRAIVMRHYHASLEPTTIDCLCVAGLSQPEQTVADLKDAAKHLTRCVQPPNSVRRQQDLHSELPSRRQKRARRDDLNHSEVHSTSSLDASVGVQWRSALPLAAPRIPASRLWCCSALPCCALLLARLAQCIQVQSSSPNREGACTLTDAAQR
jgi:hypothetical protein